MTAPYWSNGVATLYQADARAIPLPDGSVHCCVTSPPYWGLRDYGLASWEGGDFECSHSLRGAGSPRQYGLGSNRKHADNAIQTFTGECRRCGATQQGAGIGLEPTLSDWLANIVAVSREVWRVLRDDGTYWLNLGDAYTGGGRGEHDRAGDKQASNPGSAIKPQRQQAHGLPAKNLMGQPWRAAFALQDDGWILRSAIVWHKPNPMPESVSDRPTSAYEMVFLLTKRAHYFYDADAVREPAEYGRGTIFRSKGYTERNAFEGNDGFERQTNAHSYEGGRNSRNLWTIPTQGRPEAHFATFPDELPRRCILAGTSEHGVCADCGAPWGRQTEKATEYDHTTSKAGKTKDGPYAAQTGNGAGTHDIRHGVRVNTQTVGWQPTCDCNAADCPQHKPANKQDGHGPRHAGFNARWRESGGVQPKATDFQPTCTCDAKRVPATVLDPFIGSGTTVAVAQQLGRHGIGLDLNPDYLAIAAKRLAGISLPMAI